MLFWATEIPSGKLTSLWKVTVFDCNTKSMAHLWPIFKFANCESLPEGKSHWIPLNHHFPMVFLWFRRPPSFRPCSAGRGTGSLCPAGLAGRFGRGSRARRTPWPGRPDRGLRTKVLWARSSTRKSLWQRDIIVYIYIIIYSCIQL